MKSTLATAKFVKFQIKHFSFNIWLRNEFNGVVYLRKKPKLHNNDDDNNNNNENQFIYFVSKRKTHNKDNSFFSFQLLAFYSRNSYRLAAR